VTVGIAGPAQAPMRSNIGCIHSETTAGTARPGVADDFVDCYRRNYPRVVRALELSGVGRTVAEDLAQEAFARTFVHWRRVRHGSNPPGYVFRVAFRLARRRSSLPLEDPLPVEDGAGSQPMGDGRVGAWRRAGRRVLADPQADVAGVATLRTSAAAAVASMPPARRACAVLCLLAGSSTRDAARALGIKESTVRKQLERARADLHQAIADEAPRPGTAASAPRIPARRERSRPPPPR
jgi:RNA polymerase sigma factor (sigma-70 family)